MFPYPPEPGDGLDFTFKISNDRTKLKIYVRNTASKPARILNPVGDPCEQQFKLVKVGPGKSVSGMIYCFPSSEYGSSLQIAANNVAQLSKGFNFIGSKPGTYSGKLTFFDPISKNLWRPTREPVQPVDMRSVKFLVRVYPSGKYKLLEILD